ncbi:MAG: leucine-rich repeat domain-containing protein [Paludibacteraceae bacterium]|nr:leucine-rich repeat domain-containing protein [Paludibacteraceae bacterium]
MGVAIVVDCDFSQSNVGKVDFLQDVEVTGISLSAGVRNGNDIPINVTYQPSNTNQKGVSWSITSGSQYAAISNGVLTVLEGASNASVTVKAVSIHKADVNATLNLTGLTYKDSVDELNSITVSSSKTGTNEYQFTRTLDPSNSSFKTGTWSITNDSSYASIAQDGKLTVKSGANNSSVTVRYTSTDKPSVYGEKTISVTYVDQTIEFADPAVKAIVTSNWGSGGEITTSQAAAVTSSQFGTTFKGNTSITSFNELKYFTGLTSIPNEAFCGCTSLAEVTLPISVIEIGGGPQPSAGSVGAFNNCTSLTKLKGVENVKIVSGGAFYNCSLSESVLNFLNADEWYNSGNIVGGSPYKLSLPKYKNKGNVSISLGAQSKYYYINTNWEQPGANGVDGITYDIGDKISAISFPKAAGTKNGHLNTMVLRSTTKVTLTNGRAIVGDLYVPDNLVSEYQADMVWTTEATNIKPLSQFVPDPDIIIA